MHRVEKMQTSVGILVLIWQAFSGELHGIIIGPYRSSKNYQRINENSQNEILKSLIRPLGKTAKGVG